MKDFDKIYAENIVNEYSPKTTSKVVQLKKLDAKAKRPAMIFAYTFGVISTLIFGTGLCLTMGEIGSGTTSFIIGIILGVIGIIGACIDYPIYKKILEKGKNKYSFEIIELAKQISE